MGTMYKLPTASDGYILQYVPDDRADILKIKDFVKNRIKIKFVNSNKTTRNIRKLSINIEDSDNTQILEYLRICPDRSIPYGITMQIKMSEKILKNYKILKHSIIHHPIIFYAKFKNKIPDDTKIYLDYDDIDNTTLYAYNLLFAFYDARMIKLVETETLITCKIIPWTQKS